MQFASCFTFKFLTNKMKRMIKIVKDCVLVYFVWNKWVQNRTPKKNCSKKSYQISQSLLPRLLKAVRFIFCSALHCYVFSYLSNATRIKVLCLIVSNGTFTCSASSSVHVCYGLGVCLSWNIRCKKKSSYFLHIANCPILTKANVMASFIQHSLCTNAYPPLTCLLWA